jgi:hypothetical protein
MLQEMKDHTNIQILCRIRMMSHVERACPSHKRRSYVLLTPQVI